VIRIFKRDLAVLYSQLVRFKDELEAKRLEYFVNNEEFKTLNEYHDREQVELKNLKYDVMFNIWNKVW
jgi:hypothetical protein